MIQFFSSSFFSFFLFFFSVLLWLYLFLLLLLLLLLLSLLLLLLFVVVSAAVVVAKYINVGLLFARTCIYPVAVVVVVAAAAAVVAACGCCCGCQMHQCRAFIRKNVHLFLLLVVVLLFLLLSDTLMSGVIRKNMNLSFTKYLSLALILLCVTGLLMAVISVYKKQKQKHSITPKIYMVCFVLINSDLLNLFLCLNVSLFSG